MSAFSLVVRIFIARNSAKLLLYRKRSYLRVTARGKAVFNVVTAVLQFKWSHRLRNSEREILDGQCHTSSAAIQHSIPLIDGMSLRTFAMENPNVKRFPVLHFGTC